MCRPSSVVIVRHLYLLSSHVSTLAHRISTFYCTHDSAGLQDEAMVTRHTTARGRTATGGTTAMGDKRRQGSERRWAARRQWVTNDGKGQQGDGMTATGGKTKRHDDGDVWHDDDDPRLWDGGAIVARRGRSTLSIAVMGGGLLA